MPFLDTLGAWLLTYFVHSTMLIGTALVACYWIEKRPRVQDSLLKLALVGGMITASLQVGLGVAPLAGNVSVATAPAVAAAPVQSVTTAPKPTAAAPAPATGSPRIEIVARPKSTAPASSRDAAIASSTGAPAMAETAVVTTGGGSWISLVVMAWLIGASIFIGMLLVSWIRLRHRLSGRRALGDGPLRFMLDNLLREARIDGHVRLTASPNIDVPIAIGVVHREICVPERALTELSYEHQQSLLAHETAHLVRRDPQWRLFGSVVQGALFVQPLNRLVNKRLHAASEHLCDDWAVTRTDRPLALAKCLTVVARWIATPQHSHPVAAMASHRFGLGRRVRRLVEPEDGASSVLPRWSLAAFAAALALIVIAAPGASSASDGIDASSDDIELAETDTPIEGEGTLAPPTPRDDASPAGPSAPIAAHPAGAYPDDLDDAVRVYAYSWGSEVEDDIREALEEHGIDIDDVLSEEDLAELEELAEELEGVFGPGGDIDFGDFGDFDFEDFEDFDFDFDDFDFDDFDFEDFDFEDFQGWQGHPFDDVVIFDGDLAELEHMFDGDIDIRGLEELLKDSIDADIDIDIDIRIDGQPLEDYIDIYIDEMPHDMDGVIELYRELQDALEDEHDHAHGHSHNGHDVDDVKRQAARAKKQAAKAKKRAAKAKKQAKKQAAKANKQAAKAKKRAKKQAARAKKQAAKANKQAAKANKRAKKQAAKAKERAKRAKERAKRAKERAKQRQRQRDGDGGHSHVKPMIDADLEREIRALAIEHMDDPEELERLIQELVSESLDGQPMY